MSGCVDDCYAASRLPSFTSFCHPYQISYLSCIQKRKLSRRMTYQSSHGAVQRMPMVPPELRVCAFERGVAMGFGLFDTVQHDSYQQL